MMKLRLSFIFVFIAMSSFALAPSDSLTTSARGLMLEGDQFRAAGDVQQALSKYFSALRHAEANKDTWQVVRISSRLGDFYEKYYRYHESLPYLRRAYVLLTDTDSTLQLANVSNSIAWNFIKVGKIDSALQYAEEAVRLYKTPTIADTLNYCMSLESLGEIYSLKQRYEESSRILAESMRLGKAAKHPVIQGFTNYGIALNAFNQKNLTVAKANILACVPVAEKYASPELLADVYKLAFRIHEGVGLQKESLSYLKKFSLLNEKLHAEDIEKKAAMINANFEIQKQDDDLRLLSQQNSIQQLEIDQRSLAQKITVGAIIALLIIAALIFNRIRSQRKFERKELYRKNMELEQARKVQLSLLPAKPFVGDTFEVFGKMITATEVGGDYFDFIKLDDRRMLIAFGDATGHGMTAGMMVTITKVALLNNLSLLKDSNDVVPVARAINNSILSTVSVKGIGMALQLCVIDASANTLSMTSCGMPYPMVYDQSSRDLSITTIRQPPLGFMRGTKMELTQLPFSSQHLLLLTSDGILERFNSLKEEYGVERLVELLRKKPPANEKLQALLDDIFGDADIFAGGIPNHDDMTALCARMKLSA